MNKLSTLTAIVFGALVLTMAESAWLYKRNQEEADPTKSVPVQAYQPTPRGVVQRARPMRVRTSSLDRSYLIN